MKILLSKSPAPTAQPSTKSKKLCFLFSNVSIKQGKMGTETTKIALNAHVHLRTANQQLSPPERHMDMTSLTCVEVAGFVRTLPVSVHLACRLGCLRSLILQSFS